MGVSIIAVGEFVLFIVMYGGGCLMLLPAPVSMFKVFVESALSLLALYSVVPILFMGMGVAVNLSQVIGRMIWLNILLYFAPTPGGAGIAGGGFVVLFSNLFALRHRWNCRHSMAYNS